MCPEQKNDDNYCINHLCGQKLLVQAAGHMENVSAERGVGDKYRTREVWPGHADLARTAALTEKTAAGIMETRQPAAGRSESASV